MTSLGVADFRRKSEEAAEFRRNPFVPLCLSSSLTKGLCPPPPRPQKVTNREVALGPFPSAVSIFVNHNLLKARVFVVFVATILGDF